MTSMRERDIGAISGRLPDNLGELAYMSALDLLTTYTKVGCMTSANIRLFCSYSYVLCI